MGQKTIGWIVLMLVTLAGVGYLTQPTERKAPENSQPGYPMVLVDSYQRAIRLEREPQRVISVAPNITELVFALGKGKMLVGRTDYCDYPPAAARVASVGSLLTPNIEKIVALNPDLVIASTHFTKEAVAKLEAVGIKVAVLYGAENVDGVYATITKVGEALNTRQKAAGMVSALKQRIADIGAKVAGAGRPKVYYVAGFGKSGDYTAGAGTFIGQLLELAGAENVARDTQGWMYSREKLVQKNPDLIICSKYHHAREDLAQTSGYRELPAVQDGRLMEIDNNLLDRQGPRIADGAEALARLIHPECFR